ncbi:MAG TPA: Ldh family oxidoreductase [Hyphomicrobiaceae bacterium]|nr:Ldh family oxidoreductase [Hyphomicrobiaceae bacterium]
MATYPGAETEKRIPLALLATTVQDVFRAAGLAAGAAGTVAESLTSADLRGIHSHGVLRVPDYVKKLLDEGVDPRGAPRLISDKGAALVVDGGNNLGQVAMRFAMEQAIARAKEINVAFAAVRGSNHAGTMDYYVRMALAHDMIGIAGTNALPTMAPWGGRDKIVGINPIGIAIPGSDGAAFVLDCAFGATAHGKIRVYAQKGEPIPAGWAYDAHGQPTTDAVAALDGLIQPIGAFKGVGLGMAIGMLSSLLSGAAYGTESGNMVDGPVAGVDGQFALAINIAAFTDVDRFKSRVDRILEQIRKSSRAAGVDRLYSPGEIEADFEAAYRRDGIPLNDETLRGVIASAGRVGANVAAFTAHVGPLA